MTDIWGAAKPVIASSAMRTMPKQGATLQAHKKVLSPRIANAMAFLFLIDLISIAGANLAVMLHIHTRLDIFGEGKTLLVVAISVSITLLLLYAAGCYRRDALVRFATAIIPLAIALGITALIATLIFHIFLGQWYPDDLAFRSLSRSATLAFLSVGISLTAGIVTRLAFFAMGRRHWFERHILVIGTGSRARFIYDLFGEEKYRGYASLTFVPDQAFGGNMTQPAVPGDLIADERLSLEEITSLQRVDSVVVAAENSTLPLGSLLACKAGGIPVFEFNTFIERETGRVNLKWVDLSWLVYSHGFEIRAMDVVLKRITDIAGSLIMLAAALPVLAMASLAIALEGRGPILFRQTRVTQGGRVFEILKLRTMRVDAESNGAQWAVQKDPRITAVGSILRRFRVDEIPQLINVLRGEMSLVGPRPERPVFVDQLAGQIEMYSLRHSVKAGITGWAQLNYPYGASVEDARCKLEYDLYYMRHFSIFRDLAILLQTCRIVVWPQGVH